MKQSTLLTKYILLLLLIFSLGTAIGCDDSTNNSTETSIPNYTISFKNTSNFGVLKDSQPENEFYWDGKLSFNIIQLQDMEDSSIAETANNSLKGAMTSWISGRITNAASVDLSVFCHSERYLSFLNSFMFVSNRTDYVNDYITVDMKTGKRVMLNDLIEINIDFVKHIQTSNIAKDSKFYEFDSSAESVWEYLKQKDSADLLTELEQCSLTQEQVVQDGHYTIDESIGSLIFRNSFFLQDNTLIIVLQHGGETYITLCLDDITDYLKVEKW